MKKRKNRYKIGFYFMDPYTQNKEYEMKGLNLDDAEREFKIAMRKYK